MTKRTKVTLVAGVAALALAGIGGGVAFAAADTPTTTLTAAATPVSTPAPAPAHRHARTWAGRVEHGEFTVRTRHGDQVVDVQRGRVTSVSAGSVTIRSADGFTHTYSFGSASKVRDKRRPATVAAVRTGDRVAVLATRSGGQDTVRRLNDTVAH